MKILRGGSAETRSGKWFKFDIELDESDFQALVIKNNLDADKISLLQKYQLLTTQAELLVTVEMNKQGVDSEESSTVLVKRLKDIINALPRVAA